LRIRHLTITNLQPPRLASGPICSVEQNGGGGRNARATSRARARSLGSPPGNSPSRITAAAGSAAIIRQAQELHVSLQTLSARSLRPARQKPCIVVQKLWRMIFPCGRRRKTKNYYSARISSSQRQKRKAPSITRGLQILDDVCQTLTMIDR
jgi:hypothetical protein